MDAARNLFFAEAAGQLVGYAELWHAVGLARTTARVLVHPAWRGLGRALLPAWVQWLREQGASSIALFVDGANERARHLHESVGFVAAEEKIWYRKGL